MKYMQCKTMKFGTVECSVVQIYTNLCRSVFLSVCVCLFVCLSVGLSICLCVRLFVCLSLIIDFHNILLQVEYFEKLCVFADSNSLA